MAFDVGGGSRRGSVQPSMNVTPLVDVVLVLLIIFMVVTPMMTKQLEVHVPPKEEEDTPPPPADALPPVVLTLLPNGDAQVNGEVIAREELAPRLKRMLNARPDKVVFFDAADGVPYGDALALMDVVKGGGITELAVLSENVTAPKAAP